MKKFTVSARREHGGYAYQTIIANNYSEAEANYLKENPRNYILDITLIGICDNGHWFNIVL